MKAKIAIRVLYILWLIPAVMLVFAAAKNLHIAALGLGSLRPITLAASSAFSRRSKPICGTKLADFLKTIHPM
jgi:hypothetical protein